MIMLMMAMDDKTEKPTPKKKRDTREKGQVLKSNDVNAAFVLLSMFGILKLLGPQMAYDTSSFMHRFLTGFDTGWEKLSAANAFNIFFSSSVSFFAILMPILALAMLAGIVINYAQVGFLLTTKTLMPKFSKLNPLEGLKRMVSMRALADLLKASIKATVIIYIAFMEIRNSFKTFPALMGTDLGKSLGIIGSFVEGLALKIGIALLVIAAFDYLYQWWEYYKNLKMTKQEVKDEFKQVEGDPKVKAKIRQKQMQMGMARMMNDVEEATVVITNPTHYAAALKYDDSKDAAPVMAAKGKDLVALKIKEKAREHNIEIVEDRKLARALYETVEIGDAIPQEFFVAVAGILAEIYRIKKR